MAKRMEERNLPPVSSVPHDTMAPHFIQGRSQGRERRSPLLLGLVVPVVLVACATSSRTPQATTVTPSVGTSPSTHTPAAVSDVVPVVECPTADAGGNPGPPTSTYPDTMAVSAAGTVAEQLALYSNDTHSLPPILAPRGWSCQVSVGGDGSTSVQVFPSTASAPGAFGALSASVQQVDASSDSACQGCIYGTVCPFVPDVGEQLGYGSASGFTCSSPPAQEQVIFANGLPSDTGPIVEDVIMFTDPAGVKGDGYPSGGPYPADAVVLYDWTSPAANANAQSDGASQETCLLPTSERALCSAINQDFVSRAWMMPG